MNLVLFLPDQNISILMSKNPGKNFNDPNTKEQTENNTRRPTPLELSKKPLLFTCKG